jgi:hypothetical protein
MREPLEKILQHLAVGRVLSPYETMPWVHYDEATNCTCSAEVRMGSDGRDIEAEVQLLGDDDSDDGSDDGGLQQMLWLRAQPVTDNMWEIKGLLVKGKSYVNEFHGWEEKGCRFFCSCVESIRMEEIPDFEALVGSTMVDDAAKGGGSSGRIGRKSPNINQSAVLGMKK